MELNFKPQSRKDFLKNEIRIKDLVAKCNGDKNQEIAKAITMANSIDKPEKAYNRGYVAKELGYEHIFDVFYNRAFELGSVTKAEHRDYQIEQILEDESKSAPLTLTECVYLKEYDNTQFRDIPGSEVPDFLIKNVVGILQLTLKKDWNLDDEDEKYEYEGLVKKLTFNRVKKLVVERDGAWFGETKDTKGEKMYWFQMDSDKLRYAAEIHLGANGYDYFRIN